MKILVIDDEKDIKALFTQKFKKEINSGILEFHFEYSAEDALQYLQDESQSDIVLILSDINMPGMNGLELLKLLKNNFRQLKVFMITAYDDENKRLRAAENGADNYITKPIDFLKLKEQIFSV